jgi:hypothetical protein
LAQNQWCAEEVVDDDDVAIPGRMNTSAGRDPGRLEAVEAGVRFGVRPHAKDESAGESVLKRAVHDHVNLAAIAITALST